jgi:hypothetical protein
MRPRAGYAVAAGITFAVEVFIALAVHDRFVRPFLGDTIAVTLVYLALRAATPLRVWPATAIALGTACAVELGQRVAILEWLGLAANPLARIVLGTGYDPKDFIAYLAGGSAVLAVEAIRGKAAHFPRG